MKKIKDLFLILFSVYAVLLFICTFFVVLPIYFIIFNFFKGTKGAKIAHRLSNYWARFILFFFMIRVKTYGKENIRKDKTYVMISNHASQLDILVSAVASDNPFRFLAKMELTKVPVIGYIIKRLYVPVDRKSKTGRARSVENMNRSLAEGISIFIYPEGTRNKTAEPLLEFYDGAYRLAVENQTPIAALTIKNTGKLMSATKLRLSPGVIRCEWSKPIETIGMTHEDIPALKEKTRSLIKDNLIKL